MEGGSTMVLLNFGTLNSGGFYFTIVFPSEWTFYPLNISAISLRERELLARKYSTTVTKKKTQKNLKNSVSIVIL